MKFSILALAAGVAAQLEQPFLSDRSDDSVLTQRDLATIQQVVTDVGNQLMGLNTAVKGFTASDPNGLTQLTTAASMFQQTITDGTMKIQQTSNISLNDAIQLQSQVSSLQGTGNDLVTNLNAKQSEVEKAGLCAIIRQQLDSQVQGAKGLIDAVVSKIPQAAQSIAQQAASGFTTTLQGTQQTFAEGNCTDAAGTAGGAAAAPSEGGGGGSSGGSRSNMTMAPSRASSAPPMMTSKPATVTGGAPSLAVGAGSVGALVVALCVALF